MFKNSYSVRRKCFSSFSSTRTATTTIKKGETIARLRRKRKKKEREGGKFSERAADGKKVKVRGTCA